VRFHHFDPPRTPADALHRHWESLGWKSLAPADEPSVREAWATSLQPGDDLVLPSPRRTWDIRPLRALIDPEREVVEADFTLKILAAFRRITPHGERLLAIDWQHQWYVFDPHGGVSMSTRDEWAIPVVPLGDSYHFLAPDFRFGVSGDCVGQALSVFGRELLDALDCDPPKLFSGICRIRNGDAGDGHDSPNP
jgi:hypothetical protein